MVAVIRISGKVDVPDDVESTLRRMNIHRKYSCNVLKENDENKGMLNKVRNYVAYGKIDDKTFKKLVDKRQQPLKKEVDAEKVVKGFKDGKKLKELGIKPFFRLHPPRGGINTKKHYPKGVLGEHKNINKLINRML